MNLLLDTQALLWFVLDDSRLSDKARQSIIAPDTLVFVSPASLWEIAIKISLGKYALPLPFATFWDDQLLTNDFAPFAYFRGTYGACGRFALSSP